LEEKKAVISASAKKSIIENCFEDILKTLGVDLTDDSLCDTPKRVAKMFVDEIFVGLEEENFPKITVVENKFRYDQMLIERKIDVKSMCEHHLLPMIGFAHVAYIPKDKVLGLSKFNRIVDYYARRPQIQERLTQDVHSKLCEILETEDVAVVMDLTHQCVRMRGIEHTQADTRTSAISGAFKESADVRNELYSALR